MIKVIAFDYAEVIAEGPMSKWLKDNPDVDLTKFEKYKENTRIWDMGQLDEDQVDGILSDITGIEAQLIWEQFYLNTNRNDEVVELIKKLKASYKIILFSNFIGEKLRRLLDKFGITQLFDEIIISSDYGLKKPDPKFFDVLIKKAGVEKQEIFFTDDKQSNIDAANSYGIKAYRFINSDKLIQDLKQERVII
jgi:HAD superfamily hydrolase (TIGR01509 family)